MPKKGFNWAFAIVIVITIFTLATTAVVLRRWQKSRMAEDARRVGLEAYESQQWKKAAKNLGLVISVDRTDYDIMMKYAESQLNIRPLKSNNMIQAIRVYRDVLRNQRTNLEAAKRLISLYLQLQVPSEAKFTAERYLEVDDDIDIRRMYGVALAEMREFEQAQQQLEEVIKRSPDQIQAYEALGRLAETRPGQSDKKAEYWYDMSIENNPSSALAYIQRAGFYFRTNQMDRALSDVEKSESLDLTELPIRLRLVRELISADVLEKAILHLKIAEQQNPDSLLLWHMWSAAALKTGSTEMMKQVAENGIESLGFDRLDFMPIAIELFIRSGQPQQAREYLEILEDNDYESRTLLFLKGLLAQSEKKYYDAISYWKKAIETGDRSYQTKLSLASVYSKVEDDQSAIKYLKEVVSEYPYEFKGHLELAKLFYKTADYAGSQQQARAAIDIDTMDAEAILVDIEATIAMARQSTALSQQRKLESKIKDHIDFYEKLTGNKNEAEFLRFKGALAFDDLALASEMLEHLDPDGNRQLDILIAKLELLVAEDKIEQAIAQAGNLIEAFPQKAIAAEYLAKLLGQINQRQECEQVLIDAIERIRDESSRYNLSVLLSEFYNQWQEEQKQLNLLTSLSEQSPTNISLKRKLLRCADIKADSKRSQQIVNEIKDIEGDNGWQWRYEQALLWYSGDLFENKTSQIILILEENLAANPSDQASRMLLASVHERQENLQLALRYYRDALERSPDQIRIIIPAVTAMLKAQEYDEANQILKRAAESQLSDPKLTQLTLHCYIKQGKLDLAEKSYKDFIAQNPDNSGMILSFALLQIKNGKYDHAEQLLEQLQANNFSSPQQTAAMVELRLKQGNREQALELCNQAMENDLSAYSYLLRAKTYTVLDEPELAEKDYSAAVKLEENNITAWRLKSEFNFSRGNYDQAVADMRKAIRLDDKNIETLKHAVKLYISSGNPNYISEGKALLAEALTIKPDDVDLQLLNVRTLLSLNNAQAYKNAESILQKICRNKSKLVEPWILLIQLYLKQNRQVEATEAILTSLAYVPGSKALLLLKAKNEAIHSPMLAIPTLDSLWESEPGDPEIALELAKMYQLLGQHNKALDVLKKAIENSTGSKKELKISYAVALHKANNHQQGEKEFELLEIQYPLDAEVYYAKAMVYIEHNDWGGLTRLIESGFNEQKQNLRVILNIANSLATSNKSEAHIYADRIYKKLIEENPKDIQTMISFGMHLQQSKRMDEAYEVYNKILEIDSDNEFAVNNLAWILCEDKHDYSKALELTQTGLKKYPDYIDLIDTQGVIFYRMGRTGEAIANFDKCIGLYLPNTSSLTASYFHLARCYNDIGRKDEAVKYMRTALDSNLKQRGLSDKEVTEAKSVIKQLTGG